MEGGRIKRRETARKEGSAGDRNGWREVWNQGQEGGRRNEKARDEWRDGAVAFLALSFYD